MGPRVRGTTKLVSPLAIDDIFQRAAGLKSLDLARDIF
jgi:hypothetical protein